MYETQAVLNYLYTTRQKVEHTYIYLCVHARTYYADALMNTNKAVQILKALHFLFLFFSGSEKISSSKIQPLFKAKDARELSTLLHTIQGTSLTLYH